MKSRAFLILLSVILVYSSSFAANGCQIGSGSGSRVYINTSTQCGICPGTREPWSNGSNYIVFSNAATECNSSPYNNVNVQYIKTGQISPRINAFGNTLCYVTDGFTYTFGTSVSYITYYNCPLGDYFFLLAIPLIFIALKHIVNASRFLVNCQCLNELG
jgi:hypothetical protein